MANDFLPKISDIMKNKELSQDEIIDILEKYEKTEPSEPETPPEPESNEQTEQTEQSDIVQEQSQVDIEGITRQLTATVSKTVQDELAKQLKNFRKTPPAGEETTDKGGNNQIITKNLFEVM